MRITTAYKWTQEQEQYHRQLNQIEEIHINQAEGTITTTITKTTEH